MPATPPPDGAPATAVLVDGPAAGQTIPTRIVHLLPPLRVHVPVLRLDERPECVEWVPVRYALQPLYAARWDPDETWGYFHHPRPGEPTVP